MEEPATSLEIIEIQGNETYETKSRDKLSERCCEFHNSSVFNTIQMNLWERIQQAIISTLSLQNSVDLASPTGRFLLKVYLEEMHQVLKTNHVPFVEPDVFAPDVSRQIFERLPMNTSCSGLFYLFFESKFQVAILLGSARTIIGIICSRSWSPQCSVKTALCSTG
jgi:hypothetical protein